jgi:replicative DNA helicase
MRQIELAIPHDIETEQVLLGAIIEDNSILNEVAGILKPNSFYKPSHQHIFRAMLELSDQQRPIDIVILGDGLRSQNQLDEAGGYSYLAELEELVPSYWARIIEEHSILRDLIQKTTDISRRARDPEQNVTELLQEAQQSIFDISTSRIQKKTFHIKDVMTSLYNNLQELSENENQFNGIPTGFYGLDGIIFGLENGKFYILAGRPGMGKSALAYNIVEYASTKHNTGGAILVFTFETSREQSAARVITSNQNINGKKLRTAKLDGEDWEKLSAAINNLSNKEIYINKDSKNIADGMHEARMLNKQVKGGVRLLIFDYLQLMYGTIKKGANREQEVAAISRSLKTIATDLDCPVIAISSLNRTIENRAIKIPQLSDLRESGAIEYDADVIMFIYRDDYYNPENSRKPGVADIIVAKQKEGPTGAIELNWIPRRTKFENR